LTFDQFGIVSLIPSDFNYDGKLDLLVQYSNGTDFSELSLYYGDGTGNWVGSTIVTPNPSNQQLLLFDANNDMRVDLFGTDADGNRIYWINNDDNTWTSVPQSTTALDPIASPHSNAFVDITGDCLPDLVVFSELNEIKKMELWINTGTAYVLNQTYPLPQGAGQVSFADFGLFLIHHIFIHTSISQITNKIRIQKIQNNK
jgi:integrin alpha FG-GAP repeat containing protein 1